MNLILFETVFQQIQLLPEDPRTKHIHSVLRMQKGGILFVGFVNGERGVAELREINEDGSIELVLLETETAPPLLPIDLVIGMPRPHSARRVLYEAACLGVRSLHFFQSERSEPSYAHSRLWEKANYRERLRLGAEQSFTTQLPSVHLRSSLQAILSGFSARSRKACFVLDNYTPEKSLGRLAESLAKNESKENLKVGGLVLALGSERGWSECERTAYAESNWQFAHLGPRVLRLETAVVAAISIVSDRLGLESERTQSRLLDLYD